MGALVVRMGIVCILDSVYPSVLLGITPTRKYVFNANPDAVSAPRQPVSCVNKVSI